MALTTQEKKHLFYLDIAYAISQHAKCLRGNFGAVIVKDDIIIGTGFNGPARKVKHCDPCRRAECEPGVGYDRCVAVHAEVNAVLNAGGRKECMGAAIYVDSHNRHFNKNITYNKGMGWFPCDNCARTIVNAGIEWVVIRIEGKPKSFHVPTLVEKRLIE